MIEFIKYKCLSQVGSFERKRQIFFSLCYIKIECSIRKCMLIYWNCNRIKSSSVDMLEQYSYNVNRFSINLFLEEFNWQITMQRMFNFCFFKWKFNEIKTNDYLLVNSWEFKKENFDTEIVWSQFIFLDKMISRLEILPNEIFLNIFFLFIMERNINIALVIKWTI